MNKFESGVKSYIDGIATVTIHFPVDMQGKAHINCYQCKLFSRNNGICQLTKEICEFPDKYIGSQCPLDIDIHKI